MTESTHWLGLVAGMFTTAAFVPQVVKTWRSKSAHDLSFWMFAVFSTGLVLWLVYGLLIDAWPIVIANTITLVLAMTILYFKLRYGVRRG